HRILMLAFLKDGSRMLVSHQLHVLKKRLQLAVAQQSEAFDSPELRWFKVRFVHRAGLCLPSRLPYSIVYTRSSKYTVTLLPSIHGVQIPKRSKVAPISLSAASKSMMQVWLSRPTVIRPRSGSYSRSQSRGLPSG